MELTNLNSGLEEHQLTLLLTTNSQDTTGLLPQDITRTIQLLTILHPKMDTSGYKSLRKVWLNSSTTTLESTVDKLLKP
jgi:hypothetical protein